MAVFRLVGIVLALLGFFLVGTPLQRLIARARPRAADRIPRFFCRSLLRLAKVRVEVDGMPPGGVPLMIVPNHVSWIDILALGAISQFCFLAKAEVARWPLVSAFAAVQGTVFVDRARRRSIPVANRALAARMREGRPVLLFAEGTTVAGPVPGRFRSSHFAAARDLLRADPAFDRVAVQPVAIRYSRADAAWVGDDALLAHLWRVLRRPPLVCRIRFGAAISYRIGSDRKDVARRTRDMVAAMIAQPAQAAAATPIEIAEAGRLATEC